MSKIKSPSLDLFINTDPEILSGEPVFKGTRVPVQTLIWHLEEGYDLPGFLEQFPSVSADQATGVLLIIGKLLTKEKYNSLHEAAAG